MFRTLIGALITDRVSRFGTDHVGLFGRVDVANILARLWIVEWNVVLKTRNNEEVVLARPESRDLSDRLGEHVNELLERLELVGIEDDEDVYRAIASSTSAD